MSNRSPDSFSYPRSQFRHLAKYNRSVIEVEQGSDDVLAVVDGQAGHLNFVQVVFESDTYLRLKVTLDSKILFNHSHTDIEDDGVGKLSIPLLYGIASPIGVTRSQTSYYAIMFNGSMMDLSFDHEMIVEAANIGTATWDVQGFYILYSVARGRRPKDKWEKGVES